MSIEMVEVEAVVEGEGAAEVVDRSGHVQWTVTDWTVTKIRGGSSCFVSCLGQPPKFQISKQARLRLIKLLETTKLSSMMVQYFQRPSIDRNLSTMAHF